ncbi:MAG: CorA family divalent cation transporter, partial [Paracoccaceae bacterium]
MAQSITPLAAFDVMADGRAVPLSEPWPGPEPADGAHWRWLHLDLTDPALAGWARAHLPPIAASALLQAETRPRCDTLGDGLIVNLRGVNMNPGQDTDDM